ncbi:hypothetical protein PFISCL1PPCAC_19709, partial [Pristionchus fissidentatus]
RILALRMTRTVTQTAVKTGKKRAKSELKTEEQKRNEAAGSNGVNVKGEEIEKVEREQPDYYDSSDEEDLRNTIGNIPVQWYDDHDHIGYNLDGAKIDKPAAKGEIDSFLEKMEDPDYWRKVMDRQTGKDVVLTEEQIAQIHALTSGKCPTIGYNPYQPFLDLYSQDSTIHPIDNREARKSEFTPSKDEMKQVAKLVYAIKMGWLKPRKPKEPKKKPAYDLWSDEGEEKSQTKSELSRLRQHIPAPKMMLPKHTESYNPPEEYLFTEEEQKKWEEDEPEDRRISFIPRKYDSLRRVPAWDTMVKERYDRCLDLYLAPRQMKMKLQLKDHTDLLPDLPNPNDLKPFPINLAYIIPAHTGQVRALSFEPSGTEIVASGGEDGDVKLWSIGTGRCVKTISLGAPITSLAFCPNREKSIIAVATEGMKVYLINSEVGDRLQVSATAAFINQLPIGVHESKITWKRTEKNHGRITLNMTTDIRQLVWHAKGDYLGTLGNTDVPEAVVIHQLSTAKSQMPFSKKKGLIRSIAFAVTVPHLFIATQRHIRVYDLAKCALLKKLQANMQTVSIMRADNTGENLFVGGLDRRFSWMDLQLSTRPWRTFKHQASAIRDISYHKRLPLLATAGDDQQAVVYYAKIYTDSFKDNEIVPVKRLGAHTKLGDQCVLSCEWHPTRAWLITGGADGRIALFSH